MAPNVDDKPVTLEGRTVPKCPKCKALIIWTKAEVTDSRGEPDETCQHCAFPLPAAVLRQMG